MRMSKLFLPLAALALLALPSLPQEKTVNVGRVVANVPKPGMAKQYEEGRKRHMDWHRKQNDPWTWEVWQVQTGEATGAYLSITFNHTWKDFDTWEEKFGKGDTADAATNLEPYLTMETDSVWIRMTDVSRPPESKEPPKMAAVIHFMVKHGEGADFGYAIRKTHEAIGKTNWPAHYEWYALANGGEGPHYVLVLPKKSWADMAEIEPSFPAMLEKAFGRHEAESLLRTFGKSVSREWTEMIVYRPDLSYVPASK